MNTTQPISARHRRHAQIFLAALALWLGVASPLAAQSAPMEGASDGADAQDDVTARALFKSGRVAFEAGRYADALSSWKTAYGLTARTPLQYNIGRAHDALGQHAEAIAAYESYLKWEANGPKAAEVRERLAELQKPRPRKFDDVPTPVPAPGQQPQPDNPYQTAEPTPQAPQPTEAPQPAPVDPQPPAAAAESHSSNVWPVVLLVSGGALVLGGGIFGIAALGAESDLDALCGAKRECAPEDDAKRRALASDIDTHSLRADVLIIAGLASAGIGTWLLLSDDEPAATVACGPGSCGGSVRWRF